MRCRPPRRSACRAPTQRCAGRCADGLAAVEALLRDAVEERRPVRHRDVAPPGRGRRQAVPAAARRCWPPSSATRRAPGVVPAAVVVELTHLATLYHDDVMDEAALRRGAAERQRPLGQHRRDPHRRLPVRPRVRHPRRPRPRGRPDPGADVRAAGAPGRSARPSGPAAGADPVEHYLRGAGRQDRLADRHLRPVRRACSPGADDATVDVADPVRRAASASPSSSPTTCSTSPRESDRVRQDARHRPARGRADAAGALRAGARPTRPTPGCSSCCDADLRRRRAHAEALGLLRAHPAMAAAQDEVAPLGRRRPGTASPRCPTDRPRRPWPRSATRSSAAPPSSSAPPVPRRGCRTSGRPGTRTAAG